MEKFAGERPRSIVTRFIDVIPKNGDVLDFGSGKGINSLFLAEHGYNITAVDFSHKNNLELRQNAEKKALLNKIKVVENNINEFKFDGKFAAIICTNVLHFLNLDEIKRIIHKFKSNTIKDGINIISVFTKEGQLKSDKMYFFEKEELKKIYFEWQILFYEEKMKSTMEKDILGKPKMHEVASIVAKKI